ncbi:DeoR/GlpR family DNA-binding transcription regulator [Martelella sp. HB161492]|uniref:DeoR/GlpR family DNA-binding transcription regulator n=1 Tax=Martelella sp. HB161492 TaxID=2720726 RepID=UPI0015928D45|nr:DeoR/GlpR family DNA-binding transcription regulator [Martelella sp. HB161492]
MNDILMRERQTAIMQRLSQDGRVIAADLAADFAVSEDTIRRDLRELSARGLCERVYGGALPVTPSSGRLGRRDHENSDVKALLGRAIAAEIMPGMSVFLDASSTNIAAARAMADADVTLVTNAPAIAAALDAHAAVTVIMIGGVIHRSVGGAVDAKAVSELSQFHFDLCVLGACGVDIEAGVTCFHYDDALFKRAAAARADRMIAAVTADKIATRAPHAVTALTALDGLIVDPALDGEAWAALRSAGARLISAGKETAP